jgi:large subunit ribosomal protein L29
MATKEKSNNIAGLDAAGLEQQLKDGAEQMFRLRFQMSMGQMEGVKKYRALRKDRARIMTEQTRRKSGAPSSQVIAAKPVKAAAKAPVKKVAVKKVAADKPAVKKAAVKKTAVKKETK